MDFINVESQIDHDGCVRRDDEEEVEVLEGIHRYYLGPYGAYLRATQIAVRVILSIDETQGGHHSTIWNDGTENPFPERVESSFIYNLIFSIVVMAWMWPYFSLEHDDLGQVAEKGFERGYTDGIPFDQLWSEDH